MRRIILSSVNSSALSYLSTLSHKRLYFRKGVTKNKMFIFLTISHSQKIQHYSAINIQTLSCKLPVIITRY